MTEVKDGKSIHELRHPSKPVKAGPSGVKRTKENKEVTSSDPKIQLS